ncbi:hypothetical protein BM221_003979 [Beauveria bassiana]|uniref:Uncharacterized protein n=1 Tax=Beauveria bassiana TaxID=176275 RepID=A0A2N6NPZ3_BEABA|nr:hypothetical protein BM221_003979 [Beauveria bassiana]
MSSGYITKHSLSPPAGVPDWNSAEQATGRMAGRLRPMAGRPVHQVRRAHRWLEEIGAEGPERYLDRKRDDVGGELLPSQPTTRARGGLTRL